MDTTKSGSVFPPEHPEMNPLQAQIVELIARRTGTKPALTDRIDRLGIDSLAMAEMIYDLESTFQIRTDDELLDLATLEELCLYIEARKPSGEMKN